MSEGDIKVILDRIDRMDERLSKGIASLAEGQETIGILINDIHGRVIKIHSRVMKLEEGSPLR